VDLLAGIAGKIEGNTVCPFGEAIAWPVESYVRVFREEFEAHARREGCPMRAAAVR
jgi:NADH-quinone oxidoreductase subunit F